MSALGDALAHAVLVSNSIPAHDETTDIAREIGQSLEDFYAYVARVRDTVQADAALAELADAIKVVSTPGF